MRLRRQLEGTEQQEEQLSACPHLPLPAKEVPVYSLAAAAAAQPPCVHLPQCCQHYPHLSGRPDCGPAYLRPVGANPRVSFSVRPRFCSLQGAEIICSAAHTPCPPPTGKLSTREVRCLFMSFDFFICSVSNWPEVGATNKWTAGFLLRAKVPDLLVAGIFLLVLPTTNFGDCCGCCKYENWRVEFLHRFFYFPTAIMWQKRLKHVFGHRSFGY